ncbi:DNA mismatch repair protein pms1 [Blumeria hordei DH14]|uniref:DNA mismatch repair protein PMS1 n=1 Tax=Blumeria graminis f. sp. hordei (strain DH14) TaxID=546991 RepID=N1J502_BLUG1|nr:DNA mismatch repair protein pms1 [Blumeria hordei DH14]
MATIKPINTHTVHQIQSGQVIVDICSVVKELVENSIDAKATNIEVRFKNQGLSLIEVQDNGEGISQHNFEVLALKHHTSKLSAYSDLTTLNTYGFRGEALSSLCASSNCTVTTCLAEDVPKATRLEFKTSGILDSKKIVAAQKGTTVSIENLFKNLPVRRRELERNIKREWSRVSNLLGQYACIQTGIKFSVSQQSGNGKKTSIFSTKGNQSTKDNIANVFGAKMLAALVPIDLKLILDNYQNRNHHHSPGSKEIRISGHISRSTGGESRQAPDRQMFFVNTRPCNLPQVAKVFNEVYRSYNGSHSPFLFANIELDTRLYDVNVSPDKRTILLHDQNQILEALKCSLSSFFDSHGNTFPLAQVISNQSQTSYKQTKINVKSAESSPLKSEEFPYGQSAPEHSDSEELTSTGRRHVQVFENGTKKRSSPSLRSSNIFNHIVEDDNENDSSKFQRRKEPQSQTGDLEINLIEDNVSLTTNKKSGEVIDIKKIDRTESETKYVSDFMDETNCSESYGPPRTPFILSPVELFKQGSCGKSFELHEPSVNQANRTCLKPRSHLKPYSPASRRNNLILDESTISSESLSYAGDDSYSKSLFGTQSPTNKNIYDTPNMAKKMSSLRDTFQTPPKHRSSLSQIYSAQTSKRCKISDTQVFETENTDTIETLVSSQTSSELPKFYDESVTSSMDTVYNTQQSSISVEKSDPYEPMTPLLDHGDTEINKDKGTAFESTMFHNISKFDEDPKKSSSKSYLSNSEIPLNLSKKTSIRALSQTISTDIFKIKEKMDLLEQSFSSSVKKVDMRVRDEENSLNPEEKLTLTIAKSDFAKMKIIGQFNLGFILVTRFSNFDHDCDNPCDDDIFIIDQHASDEKYNFERLQASTIVQSQKLVIPKTLDLTALEEEIVAENSSALQNNGFTVTFDTSGNLPTGKRCKLTSLPLSYETAFSVADLEELLSLLADNPPGFTPRPSKVQKMLAMRACRSSIMIGKTLTLKQMEKIVLHLGELDKPWNCPHGRPTMRHLFSLGTWDSRQRVGSNTDVESSNLRTKENIPIDWAEYLQRNCTENS